MFSRGVKLIEEHFEKGVINERGGNLADVSAISFGADGWSNMGHVHGKVYHHRTPKTVCSASALEFTLFTRVRSVYLRMARVFHHDFLRAEILTLASKCEVGNVRSGHFVAV